MPGDAAGTDQDDRYQRITLRIPRDLHRRLMAEAKRRTRSLNAEVVARLEANDAPGHADSVRRFDAFRRERHRGD